MNFRVFRTTEDLAAAAADVLLARARETRPLVVSLSGGTTPRALYTLLGGDSMHDALSELEITWVVGDERCVPPDDPESNWKMIRESLFREGVPAGHRVLCFRTELGDAPRTARDFEMQWHTFGITGIDLALLGVGEDGHTASLFPGTPILDVRDRIAAAVFVPPLDKWRVSITLPVLSASRMKLILAAGTSKRDILQRCRQGERLPVVEVAESGGEAWWMVDDAAYPG